MKIFIFVVLLSVNLSGCVGYTFSKNSNFIVEKFSPDEIRYHTKPNKVPEKVNSDGSEVYVTYDDRRWCGLTIFAIIPIPLWLPVCHNRDEVTYKNDMPIQKAHQSTTFSGALCGPFIPLLALGGGPKSICSSTD